jgi:hypothetical protein
MKAVQREKAWFRQEKKRRKVGMVPPGEKKADLAVEKKA